MVEQHPKPKPEIPTQTSCTSSMVNQQNSGLQPSGTDEAQLGDASRAAASCSCSCGDHQPATHSARDLDQTSPVDHRCGHCASDRADVSACERADADAGERLVADAEGCGCAGCDCGHADADAGERLVADAEGCGCAGCDCEHADAEGCGCAGCDCEGCDCGCDCDGEVDPAWLDEHAPAVDTPAPEEVVELVYACVQFVQDALGVELDFTPETLPVLDHYLAAARETVTERAELRELLWRFAGAYFGELVRRRFNGFWHLPSPDVFTWRINFRTVLLSFNPVGAVTEAIVGSDQSQGPTGALRVARPDQEELSRRLGEMPPLPQDQYFLLSTRLEVIDTVVEHLRMRMSQNDQVEVEFDPDDYANDLQPYGSA